MITTFGIVELNRGILLAAKITTKTNAFVNNLNIFQSLNEA